MFETAIVLLTVEKGWEEERLVEEALRLVSRKAYLYFIGSVSASNLDSIEVRLREILLAFEKGNQVQTYIVAGGKEVSEASARQFFSYNSDVEVVLSTFSTADLAFSLCEYAQSGGLPHTSVHLVGSKRAPAAPPAETEQPLPPYVTTCVGGTFDRLHVGHKVLLTVTALLASEKVVVGVTSDAVLAKKYLSSLIAPSTRRIALVEDFLFTMRKNICFEVVAIDDAFGPSIVDPTIGALVVSKEVVKGGEMVREKRRERGLCDVDLVVVDLVADTASKGATTTEVTGDKMSSSSIRSKDLLRFRFDETHWARTTNPRMPYTIGVSGAMCSGKSLFMKKLSTLGYATIDCDKIGHEVYLPGTEGFRSLVEAFGARIVSEEGENKGEINRKVLGSIVFSDERERQKLNAIVWPLILGRLKEKLEAMHDSGIEVCFVEAAVLVEAGWDRAVDEHWAIIVPESVSVARAVATRGMSEQEAGKRLASQISINERVNRAHVVVTNDGTEGELDRNIEKSLSELYLRRLKPFPIQQEEDGGDTRAAKRQRPLLQPSQLVYRWITLMKMLTVNTETALKWWRVIFDHYSESHRVYHTLTHIDEMFCTLDSVALQLKSPITVHLAVFFHDIIYDPARSDNERLSADLFGAFGLEAGMKEAEIEKVSRYINATASHLDTTTDDGDLKFFLDTDLSILGSPRPKYGRYKLKIRLEYAHVPLSKYLEGREKVLLSFLKKKLFFTSHFDQTLADTAQSNIKGELEGINLYRQSLAASK